MMEEATYLRARLIKGGLAIYCSSLDVQRTLERALRRAGLPVAYSQGYTPHPKLHFSQPLPVGVSSEAEFFDCQLSRPVAPAAFARRLNDALPAGLRLAEARSADPGGPALGTALNRSALCLCLRTAGGEPAAALDRAAAALLAADTVRIERRHKQGSPWLDIRPLVHALATKAPALPRGTVGEALPSTPPDCALLYGVVEVGVRGNLRPAELAEALGQLAPDLAGAELVWAHRLDLFYEAQGQMLSAWEL